MGTIVGDEGTEGQGTEVGGHIRTSVTWGQGSGDNPPPAVSPHAPSPISVLQRELNPPLSPDILAAVAAASMRPTRPPTLWASSLDGFPPAWPMAAAVTRHCRHPPQPSPTPPLPRTAFAHLRRQAAALDALRPRLNACCRHHAPLPCARRAVSPPGMGGGGGWGHGDNRVCGG